MLDRIPAEVLRLIVEKIGTQSDLKSLCEVSKYVAEFATPCLYESITLHADEMLDLDDLKHKIELCSNDNVKFTKNICFKAPLHHNLRKRCPHYDSELPEHLADVIDMDYGSEVDMSLDPFWDLSMALIDWMCTFGDNNLQSLSLNLGCCVPNEILNYPGNYWTEKQKRIQSISLLTDGECPTFACVEYLDLKSFTSIQSLSWKGLSRGDHFECLEDFIKNQTGARGLRRLTLDLVEWNRAEKGWYDHQKATLGGFPPRPDNFFATRVVGIESDQNKVLFQSLKTLLLVGVAFAPFENEFGHSFNMMNLSTLQLRNCPSSLELLGALLEQGITPKLKSFELIIDWDCLHHYSNFDEVQTEVIFRFLASFQGLEDLFLLLTQPLEWYLIANSIAHHQSTLKRLVLHERIISNGEVVDGGIPWHNSGELLFHDSRLSCFGTSGPISEMESSFAELPVKPRCHILHIKMSWIDHHKKFKEEFYNVDPEHSGFDFEDFELIYEKGGKFLSYPQAETFNETVDTAQTLPSNRSPSSEPLVLTMQEPQISTRTRKIANRSDFTGPAQALLKFARWAFSSEGIPELRILAWGDFSNDGRWGESNVMLCRDQSLEPTGTNFRALRDSDFNYWDLIDENMDMLSACSPDHLLWAKEAVF